jgi:DNA-3-methyladenine glycosylase
MTRLTREFFERDTLLVAQELLGKKMIFNEYEGIITETEAYTQDDPACHAFSGITPRTRIMFGQAGLVYVYLIYGMYHCLNFVTEKEGIGCAVLIRGLQLPDNHLNGPGKLCKKLNITKEQNGIDVTTSSDFYILESGLKPHFKTTRRIGINKGQERLWRFVIEDVLVSKKLDNK